MLGRSEGANSRSIFVRKLITRTQILYEEGLRVIAIGLFL